MKKEEPIIEISKEFVKEKFKEYNDLYFNGELKMPKITLIDGTKYAGQFVYKKGGLYAKPQDKDKLRYTEIQIAENIIWTEKSFRSVLVHEMIHYYIQAKNLYQHWLFDIV